MYALNPARCGLARARIRLARFTGTKDGWVFGNSYAGCESSSDLWPLSIAGTSLINPKRGTAASASEKTSEGKLMIRNFQFAVVALVALASSAFAASVASADEFKSESAPVTLTGKQGEPIDTFSTHAGNVKCTSATYKGTQSSTSTTTIQVAPTYSGCTFVGLNSTITTNGCEYLFHVPATAGVTTGTVDIVCPGTNEITVTAPTPALGKAKCIVHVPPQTGLGTVTYSNIGSGTTREVKVAVSLSGIKYSQTAGVAESGNCGTQDSTTTGTYVGGATVTGEVEEGSTHIGLFLS